jgi:anti-sigma B factor antagonist
LDEDRHQSYTSKVRNSLCPMTPIIKVVQPTGILDSTKSNQFRQEICELLDDEIDAIIIDFKDVTFMDSSGLGALVMALKNVRSAGAKLFICSVNEQIKMLFELTSMDRVFKIFSSKEDLEETILHGSPSDLEP